MSQPRPTWLRAGLSKAVLLTLVFVVAAPLRADKKKAAPTSPGNPGDQRVTGYFDISRIVWPNPPAIPRIRFVDLFTGEKIDRDKFAPKKRKKSWMDRMAGAQQTDEIRIDSLPFQLIRAYGVAVDSKGRIYTADQGVGAIFIFNSENKANVELIANGKQANFGLISGLAMDDNDRLFVVDTKLRHVAVFSSKHQQEGVFGADVLVHPGGIAIDRENRFVYVVDTGNDVVDVFDADTFKFLRQLGKPSKKHEQTEPGTFSLPEGVAVDGDGNVYVTDTFNNRVEIFDADGGFIGTFGKNGDGPADFQRPKGIAVDCDGHIWVVDSAQNRVKIFSNKGRLLIYFGEQGYYPGQFMGPWGITIDQFNRVMVSETFPGRVQVFRYVTDSEFLAEKKRREGGEQKTSSGEQKTTPEPAKPATSVAAVAGKDSGGK